MQYRYVAYTLTDGISKGVLDADTVTHARTEIARRGLKPIRIAPVHKLPGLEAIFPSLFSVGASDLILFARHLSTMLTSGGNLIRALDMLQSESRSGTMRKTVAAIRKSVDQGVSLSDALTEHHKVFSPLFVSVVNVGEYTGRIAPALEQLADNLEREHEYKQKAIRTMMYPLAIIALSLLTMFVLMTVSMPTMLRVFSQMGAEVPAMTRIAVNSMSWVKDNINLLFFGVVGLIVLVAVLRRNPRTKPYVDAGLLRSPLLSGFIITSEVARFSRTMAMLLSSGVSLAAALQLSIRGCGNETVRRAFQAGEESLLDGHSLTKALKGRKVLPSLFVELLVIGEETNSLRQTLDDAAVAYQKQLERRLDALLAFMEPASTVVVGGIIGFIAFSMFVPIYSGLGAL
jgi:type IV pilus assembly protein PilC